MAQVPIPEEYVTAIDQIAEGVTGLRIAFVNVFGIQFPDGSWTLVDAGIPLSSSLISRWAERHFGTPPRAIVLTHGHFDHVSAAPDLARKWNVPVYAHPLEVPYLNGQQEYPRPDVSVGGGLMTLLSPLYPRGPIDLAERLKVLTTADMGDDFEALPGWIVVHTPGHTPGHISLFRPSDRLLVAGDAFCTTKPESFFDAAIAQSPELHEPPAYFTSDWAAASRSIHKLANLDPRIVAPGHGKPLAGEGVAAKLRELAQQSVHGV